MNTKQGAQRLISYNCAKPAFCGFHLCIIQCVLSLKVFVWLYVGAETAEALWFLQGSPCCALGSQRLTYEQRGNYQHSLWTGVAHEFCRTCRQWTTERFCHPDQIKRGQQQKREKTTVSVCGRVSSEHVLSIRDMQPNLTFKRVLSMCLPTLPPVVVFGGELVMLI